MFGNDQFFAYCAHVLANTNSVLFDRNPHIVNWIG